MIKVYPIIIEAADENHRKVFTMSMEDEGVFNINLHTMFSKDDLDSLFDAIHKGMEIMEIEK